MASSRARERFNLDDGIYTCEECGLTYCYDCRASIGATIPKKLEHGFCSDDCRKAFNEKADPDETELNKSAWAQSERMPAHERRA